MFHNLVSTLDGPDTSCVGYAVGLDRLVDEIISRDLDNVRSDIGGNLYGKM